MRDAMGMAVHTLGYLAVTTAVVWLILRYVPA
jgi:hypothetical protein